MFPLMTDSYKLSHYVQYPPKTSNVYSYLESRGGEFDDIVFFGLQYILKAHMDERLRDINPAYLDQCRMFCKAHFGYDMFNYDGWMYIYENYISKGKGLPIIISAVPEGTVVPNRNVLMTIENTDPNCYWLTNYLETILCQIW